VTTGDAALEAFWRRLERLRVEDMLALAARPLDEDAHAAAVARAEAEALRTGMDEPIEEARTIIDDWVLRLFNSSTAQPGWMEANWGRPGTIEDRANLAASLGEVALALIVGDGITDDDRDELLGAWAELAG
jgi:hypothetical protein